LPVVRIAVVVPVKAFARAKARLAPALDEAARADLARRMAERVLGAAGDLPVTVACDDDDVAAWARSHGATVAWVPGTDLNGAVTAAVAALDADVAVVAHADLPRAVDLGAVVVERGIALVPDRRHDGTNVLCVPTGTGFEFKYGPGSFARHVAEAARVGLPHVVLELPDLMWDVDEPGDLPCD
jgi:2-phospho-L-lactate guanylyltransferase